MGRVDYINPCVFCGKPHTIKVDLTKLAKWQKGELIQKAMPELTKTEREFLVSGICSKCQVKIFGSEDE